MANRVLIWLRSRQQMEKIGEHEFQIFSSSITTVNIARDVGGHWSMSANVSVSVDLLLPSAVNYVQSSDRRRRHRLLAPTVTTLLQQQAREHQQWKQLAEDGCHLSGRPTLSYPSNEMEKRGAWKCSFRYHFQSHRLTQPKQWSFTRSSLHTWTTATL